MRRLALLLALGIASGARASDAPCAAKRLTGDAQNEVAVCLDRQGRALGASFTAPWADGWLWLGADELARDRRVMAYSEVERLSREFVLYQGRPLTPEAVVFEGAAQPFAPLRDTDLSRGAAALQDAYLTMRAVEVFAAGEPVAERTPAVCARRVRFGLALIQLFRTDVPVAVCVGSNGFPLGASVKRRDGSWGWVSAASVSSRRWQLTEGGLVALYEGRAPEIRRFSSTLRSDTGNRVLLAIDSEERAKDRAAARARAAASETPWR